MCWDTGTGTNILLNNQVVINTGWYRYLYFHASLYKKDPNAIRADLFLMRKLKFCGTRFVEFFVKVSLYINCTGTLTFYKHIF